MNTTYDYIYWRGDIPFSQCPANEIDGLIFALLSNIEYLSVMKEFNLDVKLSLKEISAKFRENGDYDDLSNKTKFERENLLLMQNLCSYKRYCDVKIFGYMRDFNKESYTQFSAISFLLNDGTLVAAFRGTDASLVGWKEDFAMSFKECVGAQEDCLNYLNRVCTVECKKIVTCGHSKGGNLAVYAAIKATEKIINKITHVYNFDGPGFNKKIFESVEFEKLGIEKITTIVPQSSMIGILMQHEEPINVIYSSNKTGIFQHYPLTWEVELDGFRRLECTDFLSKNFDETSRLFLENMSEKEMSVFLDSVFKMFDENGAVTFRDVMTNPAMTIKTLHQVHKEIPEEYKSVLELLGKSIIKSSAQIYSQQIKLRYFSKEEKSN
jgi:hypothetical protein